MQHTITWFDLPVADLDRAVGFYSAVLGRKVQIDAHDGVRIGVFAHATDEIAGCLVVRPSHQPVAPGPLLYFNVSGRLDQAVTAVTANGGTVSKGKHQIGPWGWRVLATDSEGNAIALHAPA